MSVNRFFRFYLVYNVLKILQICSLSGDETDVLKKAPIQQKLKAIRYVYHSSRLHNDDAEGPSPVEIFIIYCTIILMIICIFEGLP